MNRRQFLRYSAFCGLSVSLGSPSLFTQSFSASENDQPPLKGLGIIDAHAHPEFVRRCKENSVFEEG